MSFQSIIFLGKLLGSRGEHRLNNNAQLLGICDQTIAPGMGREVSQF